jgi:riboflavin synthase
MAPLRGFTMDIMPETLERSNLGDLRVGDMINLERAIRFDDRLGGHLVTGHIDEVGRIEAIRPAPLITTSTEQAKHVKIFEISCSAGLARYIIPKGSVAVDGVSLTIITDAKATNTFKVSIVPHTLEATTLGIKGVGDKVNLEADLIGKYVARLLGKPIKREDISLNFLKEHGFA